jgi:hypothetical protein
LLLKRFSFSVFSLQSVLGFAVLLSRENFTRKYSAHLNKKMCSSKFKILSHWNINY